jgi:predicted TIM-barrel fold metal-dependent hydrolase
LVVTAVERATARLAYFRVRNEDGQEIETEIDAHIHWWDLTTNYYPRLMDNREETVASPELLPSRTYVASNTEDSAGYDISAVVHIEAQYDLETRSVKPAGWTALPRAERTVCWQASSACQRRQRQLRSFTGRTRLLQTDAQHSSCSIALKTTRTKCWAAEGFTVNPKWIKNYALLKKYHLGFDLMCFSNMMQRMAALAHKHPDTMIYLEHAGMPHEFDEAGDERWRSGMKALAANENVVAKISGLGTVMPNWNDGMIRPYVLETIDIFGVDRVMFASNFPTDKLFSSMDAIWQAFLSITSGFGGMNVRCCHQRDLALSCGFKLRV